LIEEARDLAGNLLEEGDYVIYIDGLTNDLRLGQVRSAEDDVAWVHPVGQSGFLRTGASMHQSYNTFKIDPATALIAKLKSRS
jgi:hypothetical protein